MPADKSRFVTLLRLVGRLIPGTYLKTAAYLNLVLRPRRLLRGLLTSFYRIDHVYEVLLECRRRYRGRFSILEFGVADGYAFTKMLYATRYLKMQDRVVVHGFDTFEGLPASADPRDRELVVGDDWVEGEYHGDYAALEAHCRRRYPNYRLHRGLFEHSLDQAFLESLRDHPPILVWVDCDLYRSARVVIERLVPWLPTGCVVYFDDIELNYGSSFTGEARVVHEVNHGAFGEGVELVLDPKLSLDTRRVYRFVNSDAKLRYDPVALVNERRRLRRRTQASPFP